MLAADSADEGRAIVKIVTPKKSWSDLTSVQQQAIVAAAAVEAVITTVAMVDLARRPQAAVRGPKFLWLLTFVVQPIGPLAYLTRGRRQPTA